MMSLIINVCCIIFEITSGKFICFLLTFICLHEEDKRI